MEIDFGKSYKKRTAAVKTNNFSKFSRRITLLLSALVVTFTVGLVSGLSLDKFDKAQTNNETQFANVAPPAIKDTVQVNRVQNSEVKVSQEQAKSLEPPKAKPTIEKEASPKTLVAANANKENDSKKTEDNASHLILAKVYDDPNEAHRFGLQLQKKGFPVFLAASGNRMKLYVGPIEGEANARKQLAQIKGLPDFQGAILYRK